MTTVSDMAKALSDLLDLHDNGELEADRPLLPRANAWRNARLAMLTYENTCQHEQTEAVDGWFLPASKINDLQQKSVADQIKRCKQAHYTDLRIRMNGEYEFEQADWIKHMIRQPEPRSAQLQMPTKLVLCPACVYFLDCDGIDKPKECINALQTQPREE